MAQREQANVALLLTIGIISGLLIIVLGIGLEAWYLSEVQEAVQAKWDGVKTEPVADRRTAQWNNITTLHWVDKDKKVVAIPIEDAMKIVAADNGNIPSTNPTTKMQ
jgi:hypothetical protein